MAAPPPPPPAALGTPISIGAGGEVRALAAAAPTGPQAALYPLSNYSFGPGAQGADKDAGLEDRLRRMKNNYDREGARRTYVALDATGRRAARAARRGPPAVGPRPNQARVRAWAALHLLSGMRACANR